MQILQTTAIFAVANAWQIPGILPKNYEKGMNLDIMVGQLESVHNSFGFDFYMINWCSNQYGLGYDESKYGTTLTGTPLHESPYQHTFGVDQNVMLCKKTLTLAEITQFSFMI